MRKEGNRCTSIFVVMKRYPLFVLNLSRKSSNVRFDKGEKSALCKFNPPFLEHFDIVNNIREVQIKVQRVAMNIANMYANTENRTIVAARRAHIDGNQELTLF